VSSAEGRLFPPYNVPGMHEKGRASGKGGGVHFRLQVNTGRISEGEGASHLYLKESSPWEKMGLVLIKRKSGKERHQKRKRGGYCVVFAVRFKCGSGT